MDYLLKAGQKAMARSAMTEAAAQLQKGLDLLASVPDGQSRQQQELRARTRIFESRNGEGIPSVTQRE